MNGPNLGPGGPEGPPDGDYARYVERLLQRADQQRGAAQAAAKAGDARAAPAQAAFAVASKTYKPIDNLYGAPGWFNPAVVGRVELPVAQDGAKAVQ